MNTLLLAFTAVGVAFGVVLFDKSNMRDFSLISVTRDEGIAYLYYTPPGVLSFPNTSTATLRATRSASGGRFSGISAPLNRDTVIAALNTSENMIIDIDYTFSMYDTSDKLSLTGHGTGQYVMLTDDTSESYSHTGVVVEYGGGASPNLMPSAFNWTKPGCSIYRFETNENNGLLEHAFVRPPVFSNDALVRYGRFRMLLRFLFNPSDMHRLSFLQMRLEVRNNMNYTGVLVDFVQPASTLAYTRTRVSQWFNRTSTKAPRLYLFGSRTDFDIENIQINATLNRTAPSFDSVWGVATTASTSTTTTATTTATTASPSPPVVTAASKTQTATMQPALTLPPVQGTTGMPTNSTDTSVGSSAANVSVPTTTSATFQGNQTAPVPTASDTTSVDANASSITGDDRIAMIAAIVCLAVCCVCLMLVVLLRRHIKARFSKQNEEALVPLHKRSDRVDELFHTLLREATEPTSARGAQQNVPKRTQEYHSSRLLTSEYGAGPAPVVVDGTKAIYNIVPNDSVYSQPPAPRSSSAVVSDVDTEDGSDSHNRKHARKARANEYDVVGKVAKTPYESVTSKLD